MKGRDEDDGEDGEDGEIHCVSQSNDVVRRRRRIIIIWGATILLLGMGIWGPHLVEDGEGDAEDAGGDEADEVVRGPDVERHPAAERRQPDHQHQVQLIRPRGVSQLEPKIM